jgi:hypothetical protein
MKRRYLTFTIRQLKAKISQLSRTTFKITRKFFKSRLGITKRDWSRLTKAEIIRVLNYYYASLAPNTSIVKTLLIGHQFKLTTPETFTSLLPKLRVDSGQQWQLIDEDDISELSNLNVPLYYSHFQKVYPHGHQLNIWDNPDCFMVIAQLGKQFYAYVFDTYSNVTDFLVENENQVRELLT